MSKTLFRIVAVLLLPCLVINPTLASAVDSAWTTYEYSTPASGRFQAEGLAVMAELMKQLPFRHAFKGRQMMGAEAESYAHENNPLDASEAPLSNRRTWIWPALMPALASLAALGHHPSIGEQPRASAPAKPARPAGAEESHRQGYGEPLYDEADLASAYDTALWGEYGVNYEERHRGRGRRSVEPRAGIRPLTPGPNAKLAPFDGEGNDLPHVGPRSDFLLSSLPDRPKVQINILVWSRVFRQKIEEAFSYWRQQAPTGHSTVRWLRDDYPLVAAFMKAAGEAAKALSKPGLTLNEEAYWRQRLENLSNLGEFLQALTYRGRLRLTPLRFQHARWDLDRFAFRFQGTRGPTIAVVVTRLDPRDPLIRIRLLPNDVPENKLFLETGSDCYRIGADYFVDPSERKGFHFDITSGPLERDWFTELNNGLSKAFSSAADPETIRADFCIHLYEFNDFLQSLVGHRNAITQLNPQSDLARRLHIDADDPLVSWLIHMYQLSPWSMLHYRAAVALGFPGRRFGPLPSDPLTETNRLLVYAERLLMVTPVSQEALKMADLYSDGALRALALAAESGHGEEEHAPLLRRMLQLGTQIRDLQRAQAGQRKAPTRLEKTFAALGTIAGVLRRLTAPRGPAGMPGAGASKLAPGLLGFVWKWFLPLGAIPTFMIGISVESAIAAVYALSVPPTLDHAFYFIAMAFIGHLTMGTFRWNGARGKWEYASSLQPWEVRSRNGQLVVTRGDLADAWLRIVSGSFSLSSAALGIYFAHLGWIPLLVFLGAFMPHFFSSLAVLYIDIPARSNPARKENQAA